MLDYFPKDKPTDERKISFLLERQSQRKVAGRGKKLEEQQKVVDEKLQKDVQTPKTNFTKSNHIEDFLFPCKVATLSGSFPLDTVFILLLIHSCGADLLAALSAVICRLFSIDVFVDLVFGMTTIYYMQKWKREREVLLDTIFELQRQLMEREQDKRDETATLVEVKTKLKTWMDHLRIIAEEAEAKIEENKQKLKSVEMGYTEEAKCFGKSWTDTGPV
ncbi:uncharacterized protein LOC118558486 [Fundulus heteroclitus]|uniref:uncharacterized protein LOC118558486 n=1 Tax=Fundulus heteroclitus TaxID=8078 RepID=UPI00165AAF52|nr:uncharacterized protein LOC118558486 [Fundulus heteroclitus]